MKAFFRFTALCMFLTILSLAVYAESGVRTEITTDSHGNIAVRTLAPGNSEQVNETAAPDLAGADQTVLWMDDHPTSIANNVDIYGNAAGIMTGWYLNEMRCSKYNTLGTGVPLWEYPESSSYYLPVSCSDDGNVIASIGSGVPLVVWLSGAGPSPSWTYTLPTGYVGVDCDVSDDGTYIAAGCKQSGTGTVGKLILFSSASSTPLWTMDYNAGNQLNGVEISENNGWITVGCYSNFFVYSLSTGSLFFTGTNYSQTMVGIDDDAEWLASGDFNGLLHVWRRVGATYLEQWSNSLGGWVTAVDISSDASTVLAGNFSYYPVNGGLVRAFDINGTVRWSYNQYGDYVSDVALCSDGSVGVAGSWGMLNATFGDVFTAFEMVNGSVILRLLDDIDEPGSIFDVAISDNGAYATCGGKAVHARTFGNGGETYALELLTIVQDITITMTPINPPIVIPAGGGSFDFNVTVTNTGTSPTTFQGWILVKLPDGSYYGPVMNTPVTLTLPAGGSLSRVRTQVVPGSAPPGLYDYIGYVGTYPSAIADSSSFPFSKSGAGSRGMGFGEWTNTGESFDLADVGAQHAAPCSGSEATPTIAISPNPFNPTTTLTFTLPEASVVRLEVFDVSGREVGAVGFGESDLRWYPAGSHEITFDGLGLPSGVYYYRLAAGANVASGKMVLMK